MTAVPDPVRARAYRRMRVLAGALLAAMFVLFVAARRFEAVHPAMSYLRAFAEAAMIGGLADWFAVTALFRHPLGLPIPHTAIVPRNKDRIGTSLGDFVANNFLSPEAVLPKIRAMGVRGRLSAWLCSEANARFAARRIAAAIPPLVRAMQDEPVQRLLRDAAITRLERLDAGGLLARFLSIAMAGGRHLALFDAAILAATRFVADNEAAIRARIADKTAWWVPDWIDDKLARRIVSGLVETLEDMRAPDHPWRRQFEAALSAFIWRLVHAEDTRTRAEALKAELVAHPELVAYIETLWQDGKQALLGDLAEGGDVEAALTGALTGLGQRLAADEALGEVVESWVNRAVLHIVVPNRQRIGAFMAGVVRNWDTRTLVAKLEMQVGRDLQYIRINGTLVGGLAGLAIHGLGLAAF